MSASKARPLEATGRRSAAGAPARRTARNQRFEAWSNWLKTRFPAYSRTAVGAPGVATVWAGAAAGSARTTAAATRAIARCRRDMSSRTPRSAGSNGDWRARGSAGRLVARDGEPDEQRDVDGVDDQRQRQDDEDPAGRAVVDEDELEHAGDHGIGQE